MGGATGTPWVIDDAARIIYLWRLYWWYSSGIFVSWVLCVKWDLENLVLANFIQNDKNWFYCKRIIF